MGRRIVQNFLPLFFLSEVLVKIGNVGIIISQIIIFAKIIRICELRLKGKTFPTHIVSCLYCQPLIWFISIYLQSVP